MEIAKNDVIQSENYFFQVCTSSFISTYFLKIYKLPYEL